MINKEDLIDFAKFYRKNWHKMHHKNSLQAVDYYLKSVQSSHPKETPKVSTNKSEKELCDDCGANADYYVNGKNYCDKCVDGHLLA